MRDHGLFQAICRVNRLDGDDKDYGYIVDYRDLFNSLQSAITDYTGGALDGYERKDIEGLLSNRLEKAKGDLDEALETVRALCEMVAPPRGTLQYQQYFCAAEPGKAEQLKANEPKRVDLYKAVATVTRRYGNLANEMEAAGYTADEAAAIKTEIAHFAAVRDEVKLGAGEKIDFKQYEAGMRFLLDTYIQADASEIVADFQDTGLVQLIVQMGDGALGKLPKGIRADRNAVAETIVNNVRKVIIDEHALNPRYYEKMSSLLDDLIKQRQQEALELQAVPRETDRARWASRHGWLRHCVPRMGQQRSAAGTHRLRANRRAGHCRGSGCHANEAGSVGWQSHERAAGQARYSRGAAPGLRAT